MPMSCTALVWYFYPRPPRGGRQLAPKPFLHSRFQFLSTPSARRATRQRPECDTILADFYPRPPRGGRPQLFEYTGMRLGISIHALREEGDGRTNR